MEANHSLSVSQRHESRHKEVKSGERHHIDGQFPKICVQLTGKSETGGDSGHGEGDKMIQITISGSGQFQGLETNVIESFIVDTESFIGVFYKLVDGESCVVGFDDSIRYLKKNSI